MTWRQIQKINCHFSLKMSKKGRYRKFGPDFEPEPWYTDEEQNEFDVTVAPEDDDISMHGIDEDVDNPEPPSDGNDLELGSVSDIDDPEPISDGDVDDHEPTSDEDVDALEPPSDGNDLEHGSVSDIDDPEPISDDDYLLDADVEFVDLEPPPDVEIEDLGSDVELNDWFNYNNRKFFNQCFIVIIIKITLFLHCRQRYGS